MQNKETLIQQGTPNTIGRGKARCMNARRDRRLDGPPSSKKILEHEPRYSPMAKIPAPYA